MSNHRLFVGFMLAAALFAPMVHFDSETDEFSLLGEDFLRLNEKNTPDENLFLSPQAPQNSARAPSSCQPVALQNDAGTTGDAGNASTNTAKSIGADPTTSFSGCASSTTDVEDWYEFSLTNGSNIDVQLDGYAAASAADYDLYLIIEDNGSYYYVDLSWSGDPVETVSSVGTSIEGVAGTYWIAVIPYGQGGTTEGDYNLQTWTNYTESCSDWYNPQNDGGSGQDAPTNWTDSPNNFGNNVTDIFTGCLDSIDDGDVFAFSVPVNHTIEATLTVETGNDFDLILHQPNGSFIDYSLNNGDLDEKVSSKNTEEEGLAGDYFVNMSRYTGNGNYTLSVWTNFSIPAPNLVVDSLTLPQNVNPGDTVAIDVSVTNDGTEDLNSSYLVDVYLSVDSGNDWYDHHLGNASSAGILVNTTQTVSINAPIPSSMIEGEYNVLVVLDESNVILEKDEDDNDYIHEEKMVIGAISTSCNLQDDGSTGSDAPNDLNSGTPVDLGTDPVQEFRGCLDGNDNNDVYKVTVSPGMVLNITLVSAPVESADFDMELILSDGTEVTMSNSGADDYMELVDTDYEGMGGDYYINISWWSGIGGNNPGGIYRLIIGEPVGDTFEPSFNCDGFDDMMLGQGDAGDSSNTATIIEDNPELSGIGCLDNSDSADVYEFGLIEEHNVEIMITQSEGTAFSVNLLYSDNGNWKIATVDEGLNEDNEPYVSWSSVGDEIHDGENRRYRVMISSSAEVGNYSLDIMTLEPALPDLEATEVSCGDSEGEDTGTWTEFNFVISNLGGPGESFTWELVLVHTEDSTITHEIENGTNAFKSETIQTDSSSDFKISNDVSTGDYYCQLVVDQSGLIDEQNEDNNVANGTPFSILNLDEFYANDMDRDGVNTSDTGDGIVDACPNIPGNSTQDRMGCIDKDGDGWSNQYEFEQDVQDSGFFDDSTQWNDTDRDGFGDNPLGNNGDQCPLHAAIDSDDGCPDDTDGDGVFDMSGNTVVDVCPDTIAGAEVNENGCSDAQLEAINQNPNPCEDKDSNECKAYCSDNPDAEDCQTDNSEPQENQTSNLITGCMDEKATNYNPDADLSDDTLCQYSGDATNLENNVQSSTKDGFMGMSWTMIGIFGGVIIALLLTLLVLRGGKDEMAGFESEFHQQAMNPSMDAGGQISAEQLAYEQQLIASGYPPEYARQYADQHFRPWLN